MAEQPSDRASAGPPGLGFGSMPGERRLARRLALRAVEIVAYWMPVWVPLIVLAQFGTRGLAPARQEERRLAAHQAALEARRAELLERLEQLEALHEAHGDPIYQERLRRAAREER